MPFPIHLPRHPILLLLAALGISLPLRAQDSQAIFKATYAGDIDAVQALLKKDPRLVDARDNAGSTPLHEAARFGKRELVLYLLAHGADPKAVSKYGQTVLQYFFIGRGSGDLIDTLLARGVRADAADSEGVTALHYPRDTVVAGMLLAHGADINAVARDGRTPLSNALAARRMELAQYLLDRGARITSRPFSDAMVGSDTARILFLLEHGGDPNVRDNASYAHGETPLHYASTPEIARLLLDHKGDLNLRDRYYGYTPLHARVAYKQFNPVVKVFLERGAGPNARDSAGATPLHRAAGAGNLEGVEMLLNAGADVNARARFGWTVLLQAVREEVGGYALSNRLGPLSGEKLTVDTSTHEEETMVMETDPRRGAPVPTVKVLTLLLDRGADIDAATDDGTTPLHMAVSAGLYDIVKLFIERHANLNVRNRYGATPLGIARAWVDFMARAGLTDQRLSTPGYFRSDWRYREIVEMLRNAGAVE